MENIYVITKIIIHTWRQKCNKSCKILQRQLDNLTIRQFEALSNRMFQSVSKVLIRNITDLHYLQCNVTVKQCQMKLSG